MSAPGLQARRGSPWRARKRESATATSPATILFVPGFVVDTYSEIEAAFVELCAHPHPGVRFVWLVPDIAASANAFARPENRRRLSEPVWVSKLKERGIPYVVGNLSKYNLFANFMLFRRVFRAHPVDAVYTHFGMERYWAVFFGKLWGKKTIWNEHWHSLGGRHVLFKKIFYGLFVNDFIAVSSFIGSTLPRNSRVHTILNAIHPEVTPLAEGQRDELRAQLGIPAGCKLVLMVAAFRAEKRHLLALDICEKMLARRHDVMVVFLGTGVLRQAFLDEARRRGLEQRLFAPGYIAEVGCYYAVADICMLTSYWEPFGYCVLEAMKYSLPVVAFAHGGPAEVIENAKTGILIDEGDADGFANALVALLEDDDRRRRVGGNARAAVMDRFSRAVWIERLKGTLCQIAGRTGSR